ncbi:unnamed protein product, partial [Protopolystoma xenopodis]
MSEINAINHEKITEHLPLDTSQEFDDSFTGMNITQILSSAFGTEEENNDLIDASSPSLPLAGDSLDINERNSDSGITHSIHHNYGGATCSLSTDLLKKSANFVPTAPQYIGFKTAKNVNIASPSTTALLNARKYICDPYCSVNSQVPELDNSMAPGCTISSSESFLPNYLGQEITSRPSISSKVCDPQSITNACECPVPLAPSGISHSCGKNASSILKESALFFASSESIDIKVAQAVDFDFSRSKTILNSASKRTKNDNLSLSFSAAGNLSEEKTVPPRSFGFRMMHDVARTSTLEDTCLNTGKLSPNASTFDKTPTFRPESNSFSNAINIHLTGFKSARGDDLVPVTELALTKARNILSDIYLSKTSRADTFIKPAFSEKHENVEPASKCISFEACQAPEEKRIIVPVSQYSENSKSDGLTEAGGCDALHLSNKVPSDNYLSNTSGLSRNFYPNKMYRTGPDGQYFDERISMSSVSNLEVDAVNSFNDAFGESPLLYPSCDPTCHDKCESHLDTFVSRSNKKFVSCASSQFFQSSRGLSSILAKREESFESHSIQSDQKLISHEQGCANELAHS